MKDTKFDVDLVELNGRKTEYTKENSSIKINNFWASNNQFAEIHMKYKYYTNEDKSLLRQESKQRKKGGNKRRKKRSPSKEIKIGRIIRF